MNCKNIKCCLHNPAEKLFEKMFRKPSGHGFRRRRESEAENKR